MIALALLVAAAVPARAQLPAAAPVPGAVKLPKDAVEGLSGLPVPRFASLRSGKAFMRTGPGEQYPVSWVYQRSGLPVEIVKEYGIWRQVRDPDGTEGWMNKNLLSGERTGFVTRSIRYLRSEKDVNAKVAWRVQPGAVGRLLYCAGAWCRMSVDGKSGFILRQEIWGVYPTEVIG